MVKIEKNKKYYIVRFEEEPELYSGYVLKEEIEKLIAKGEKYIIFDFTGYGYIPSILIALIVNFALTLFSIGGTLKLIVNINSLLEALKFSKIENLIPIYKTLEEALND